MITKNAIALLVLAIGTGFLVDATLRGDQSGKAKSDRSLKGKTTGKPNIPSSSLQNELDGYNSCDDLKADLVKSIKVKGNATIQSQKDINCDSYYYYSNGTSSPNNTDDLISNRRLAKKGLFKTVEPMNAEASFKANNQVDGVDEQNTIVSDGKYIFVGERDNIIVLDLNGSVVANVSLPAPLEQKNKTAWQYITSVSIDDNILTVLANIYWYDYFWNQDSSTRAFIYQVNFAAKNLERLTLVKEFDLLPACTNAHCNIEKSSYFDSRSTGRYTYAFNVVSQAYGHMWEYHRCSEFKNLTATEYEQVALELLSVDAEKDADEIVNVLTVGVDKETQLCKDVRKIPEDIFVTEDRLSFLKVTSFVYNKTSKSVQVDTFAVPFSSWNTPVVYVTKNSTLIALPSPNSDTASLLKYDVSGTKFTLKAVGSIKGVIYSSSAIDYYNGHYRIAVNIDFSTPQIFVLQEKESQLQIVGQVKGFASTGEYLSWVKFVADKGFVQINSFDDKTGESKGSWKLVNLSDPTQPRFVKTKLSLSMDIAAYPIEGGKYIVTFSQLNNANGTGIAVQLLQVTQGGIKLLHNKAESILLESKPGGFSSTYSDISYRIPAFRYLPQSQTVVVPVHAYGYDDFYNYTSVDGFLVYHVDLEMGVTYVRNVTQSSNGCTYLPEQSMDISGNLFTFMNGAIKKTSLANPLSAENWEEQFGCSYY